MFFYLVTLKLLAFVNLVSTRDSTASSFFFSFPGTNFCNSYLVLILVLLPTCHVFLYWTSLQALFRKIAAALPGMETLSSAKQEDMVDVNLKSSTGSAQSQPQSSGCSC